MLLLAFLVVAGVANAQIPAPCVTPPQWEGRFIRRDETKKFSEYSDIAYDEVNRRVREVEYIDDTEGKSFYDVLYLHNINKEYRIDLKNKNCTVGVLSRPFIQFGVPPDAKYVGTANIGPVNIPNEHATVIVFEGKSREADGGEYYSEVTSPDCVPVSTGFFSNRTGFVSTHFVDITAGIPDPSVFIPPPDCKPI